MNQSSNSSSPILKKTSHSKVVFHVNNILPWSIILPTENMICFHGKFCSKTLAFFCWKIMFFHNTMYSSHVCFHRKMALSRISHPASRSACGEKKTNIDIYITKVNLFNMKKNPNLKKAFLHEDTIWGKKKVKFPREKNPDIENVISGPSPWPSL